MEMFMHIWPWMGLGAAVVLLIMLFATDVLRSDTSASRWKDPTWIAWLAAVAYMIHNVEEYGLDATGAALAFPSMMEGLMGSMPAWTFFLCVNLSLVWVMGPLAAHFSRKYPALCFAMIGVEAINCCTHLPGAIALGSISGGFVTAICLFLPLVVWAFVGLCGKGRIFGCRTLMSFIGIGLIYHIGLFANMPFFVNGIYDGNVMGIEMLAVGCVVFVLWMRRSSRSAESANAIDQQE